MTWTSPKTWNVGDVASALDLNTYVRDDFAWAEGDGAYVLPTLSAGWVPMGGIYPTLAVVRRGYLVTITGVIKNTSGATKAAGAQIATSPSGYTPTSHQAVCADFNGAYGRINILSTGIIQIGVGSVVNGQYADLGGMYSLV